MKLSWVSQVTRKLEECHLTNHLTLSDGYPILHTNISSSNLIRWNANTRKLILISLFVSTCIPKNWQLHVCTPFIQIFYLLKTLFIIAEMNFETKSRAFIDLKFSPTCNLSDLCSWVWENTCCLWLQLKMLRHQLSS